MPKKKKKTSKKRSNKNKKKTLKKRTKVKKRKIRKVIKKNENQELIYKIKSDWIKKAIVNKSGYEKKYSESIKNNFI